MLGCSGMELWVYSLAFLLLISFFPIYKSTSELDNNCGPGLQTLGITFPKGDIILANGSSLEIFCMLKDVSTYNSSSLVFYHNDLRVDNKLVSIVNISTIRLYHERPKPSSSSYYCKLQISPSNKKGICLNHVFIGFPPTQVTNFTCISRNWENMNCSWLAPLNYVPTDYKLFYHERTNSKKRYSCPGDTDSTHHYCLWNSSSDPLYRAVLETYTFNLYSSNALGKNVTPYTIDHFAVVVPNKPFNLTQVNATPSSLLISWKHPIAFLNFPPGLVVRVMYQSKWELNNWQLANTSKIAVINNRRYLNLTGLKYAHTLYDIRVLIKSAKSKDEPMWWSEPATTTLHTRATVPGMAPKTDIGSFEIQNMGMYSDIFIYWQQIPKYMENGDNFEYKIIRVEEINDERKIKSNIAPITITKTYAKFTNMTINSSYIFSIVSSNKEGYSSDLSVIKVPSLIQKLPQPSSFSKIAYNKGIYELSWSPSNNPNIKSYTLFWCENKQDRPFDCKGYLNWTKVENITEKNISLPEDIVYQFAISANGDNTSSGMLWAKCTILPDQAGRKLKDVWINKVGPTYIDVSWKLDCFERVKIRGFVITYCPIRSPQNYNCKEPELNKTIEGEPRQGRIDGLKPYTTYKVTVAVKTNDWVGSKSDVLLNTTMEDAPYTSPVNVTATSVTNTTINLSWSPPTYLNGVLRHYRLSWNNNNSIKLTNTTEFTLTDLRSYEVYNISVSACTVNCSPGSDVLSIRTQIGTPGKISAPLVAYNSSKLNVSWDLPVIRGGPINHYDIKLTQPNGTDYYYKSYTTSIKLDVQNCNSVDYIQVRAVNIGPNGSEYFGPWSSQGSVRCEPPTENRELSVTDLVMIALIGVMVLITLCLVLTFVTRRAWLRFKAMQNVGVKLPPQLELNSVFKDKSVADLPISAHVCSISLKPKHLQTELLDESATPDQQLLLDNKLKDESSCDSPCDELDLALETGSGEGHVESSGCGSGHDSVSSSITAGTHITDSGTEADERPASPDVFSQSPRRLSDLRQRNIVGSGSGGEGYSRLAAVPSGYVTLPQGPRSYVSHGHKWPHNGSMQPFHKGYVTAPPLSTTTYSKVSQLPANGIKMTSNREHCGESGMVARNDGQLSLNPASNI